MTDLEFHHIGYACEDISVQRKHFERLGYAQEGASFEDPTQKIRGCFLTLGPNRVELLEPMGDDSPVWPFLHKGVAMYHLAYLSRAFDMSMEELAAQGAVQVSLPVPAVAFAGRRISFWMLRNRLLIEIVEAER